MSGSRSCEKSLQEPRLVAKDVVEKRVRKAGLVRLLDCVERAEVLSGSAVAGMPVETQSSRQNAKSCRRNTSAACRNTPGGVISPAEHLPRFFEEVEVVGTAAVGERGRERIAVAPPRAADPLQEARLSRRHRTEHHRREIADIHAHLQRGRGREQVLVPRPGGVRLEAALERFPLLALQEARVLGGESRGADRPGRSARRANHLR